MLQHFEISDHYADNLFVPIKNEFSDENKLNQVSKTPKSKLLTYVNAKENNMKVVEKDKNISFLKYKKLIPALINQPKCKKHYIIPILEPEARNFRIEFIPKIIEFNQKTKMDN